MSQTISTPGRRRRHSLPAFPVIPSSLLTSASELDRWYEVTIDRSLDVPARPQRASPSLYALSAATEEDLVNRTPDALDTTHVAEGPTRETAFSQPIILYTRGQVDGQDDRHSDQHLSEVDDDAETRGTAEGPGHAASSSAKMSRSTPDEREHADAYLRQPGLPEPAVREAGQTGQLEGRPSSGSRSRVPLQAEPLMQEVDDSGQNDSLPSTSCEP